MSKILNLEEMKNMSIDDITSMYRNGYIIEENINSLSPKIVSADGVTVSTGAILLIGLGIVAYIYLKK